MAWWLVALSLIVAGTLAMAGLASLFRWSAIGLQMRAVVESPRMTELNGIAADRVSAFAWGLSSLFAGLAGVRQMTESELCEAAGLPASAPRVKHRPPAQSDQPSPVAPDAASTSLSCAGNWGA